MSLSRVGLTGLETVIRIGVDGRSAQPFAARLECFLEPRTGADPGRFEAAVADAVRDLVRRDAGVRAERLAQRMAERLREAQGVRQAAVTITARFPERRPAPVSGMPTQEISTLHASAVAAARGTRRTIGVSAQGMTASPHAQDVLSARARERLAADGFPPARIARILERVPVATHDQLGTGALHLGAAAGSDVEFDAGVLLEIVQDAMSSEIFELMKRSDEAAVVERAHRRPRFVEDCVRAMIAGVVERFPGMPDDVFVHAVQENVETIHGHHVVAERAGGLGDLRASVRPRSSG
jgi:GTP cyclohydrolase IV